MTELISNSENAFIAFLLIIVGALAALLRVYIRLSQTSEAAAKKEAKDTQNAKDKILQDSIDVRDNQIAHLIEEGKENTALYQKNMADITGAYQKSIEHISESLRDNTNAIASVLPTIEVIPIIQDQLARVQENVKTLMENSSRIN